jgi:hypothetical protein
VTNFRHVHRQYGTENLYDGMSVSESRFRPDVSRGDDGPVGESLDQASGKRKGLAGA